MGAFLKNGKKKWVLLKIFEKIFGVVEKVFFAYTYCKSFQLKLILEKTFLYVYAQKTLKEVKKRQHYTAGMLLRLSFFVADNFFYALA